MALTRYLLVSLPAVLLVLLLLWLMGNLIAPNVSVAPDVSVRNIDFLRMQMNEQPDLKSPPEEDQNVQTEEAPPPPVPPQPNLITPSPTPLPSVEMPAIQVPDIRLSQINILGDLQMKVEPKVIPQKIEPKVVPAPATFSENLYPINNLPPQYPRRAKRRGISGWVKVTFKITEEGKVENARVLDAEPEGMFEQATLRAIANWTFQPQLLGGKATVRDVEQIIRFDVRQ